MIITLLLAFCILYFGLQMYTRHGEEVTVPDLADMSIKQVEQKLSSNNLKYKVTDSTFVVGRKPGIVLGQYPKANHKVKEGRKIFLTVNAVEAPRVKMPELIDKSLRYAQMQLKNMGLIVGEITKKPDLAKDAVLQQEFNGTAIEAGTEIFKGSTIDLIVGDGLGSTQFQMPDLKGIPFVQGKFNIQASSLRLGAVIADQTVVDTASSVIYRQSPEFYPGRLVNIGQTIDVFITHPENFQKILEAEMKLEEEEESNPYKPN